LTDMRNIEGIKKSADILNLDAKNLEVITEEPEVKEVLKKDLSSFEIKSAKNLLDNVALIKNSTYTMKDKEQQIKVISEQKPIVLTEIKTNVQSEEVELMVSSNVNQTMETKIIGAKQQLGSMMSEVARNMYLNYKPPVTAFKMNINPSNLGNISIVMKTNKTDKSMSISMNMSSANTLEVFAENKIILQSALQKNFGDNTSNVSLDFNMQSDSSSQSFEQSKQEQRDNNKNEEISVKVEERVEEMVIENQDYM